MEHSIRSKSEFQSSEDNSNVNSIYESESRSAYKNGKRDLTPVSAKTTDAKNIIKSNKIEINRSHESIDLSSNSRLDKSLQSDRYVGYISFTILMLYVTY
jgi:hypothetical protein